MFFKKKSQQPQVESKVDNVSGLISSAAVRELKEPMTQVTQTLKKIAEDASISPEVFSQIQNAYRTSIKMQYLSNQICDIEEWENRADNLKISKYSVSKIAIALVQSLNDLMEANPIIFNFDKNSVKDIDLFVDYSKFTFVLQNIMLNAFRKISYSGVVSLSIKNVNEGIENGCLFEVTYTPTNTEEKRVGQDLGVRVMKDIIYAHRGKITEVYKNDQETCVTLSIPFGKNHFNGDPKIKFIEPEEIIIVDTEAPEPNQKVEEADTSVVNGVEKPKLLIIEDHKDIRLYLQILFANEYTIVMAENGEEGVKLARKELPDLIISDVMMPVMNGFECCKLIKANLKTCHIPVILLTAMIGDEDVVKGIELGADDYILKPFNPEILRTKVKRLIKSRIELKQIYSKLLMPSGKQLEDNAQEEPGVVEDPFIAKILNIVSQNMLNPEFSVKKLSEMLNMSQPTLYRKVKQTTNLTIIELVRGVRLRKSAELLKTRQYTVQEVAEMVGYNDIPTFRKHFIDSYGTTPSTFSRDEAGSEMEN